MAIYCANYPENMQEHRADDVVSIEKEVITENCCTRNRVGHISFFVRDASRTSGHLAFTLHISLGSGEPAQDRLLLHDSVPQLIQFQVLVLQISIHVWQCLNCCPSSPDAIP